MRVLAHFNPLYYLVEAARVLSGGTLTSTAVWQAFAVLVPRCALVLTWATRVFRKAVARLSLKDQDAERAVVHVLEVSRSPGQRLLVLLEVLLESAHGCEADDQRE
jgi:hypothetical protein